MHDSIERLFLSKYSYIYNLKKKGKTLAKQHGHAPSQMTYNVFRDAQGTHEDFVSEYGLSEEQGEVFRAEYDLSSFRTSTGHWVQTRRVEEIFRDEQAVTDMWYDGGELSLEGEKLT